MKKQIIILLAILSMLVSSCSKDEIQLSKNYFGTVEVLKSGQKWKPLIYASVNVQESQYIQLEMAIYDKKNIARERLRFYIISKKEGYNAVKSNEIIPDADNENNIRFYSSYYTYAADGDVGCDIYSVADSTENAGNVTVTKYDDESGIIEGTFEVTLVKESSCNPNAPDTLHFTEGVFSTKIQD
ncbi:hypothetical protein ACE193_18450 [Bernardetia sp. OM2101]|uniref:hypothetical protein n=1 Tax=Bernardetia sp. OM2101 TaxID=3344876 RepID=UPI0035D117C6